MAITWDVEINPVNAAQRTVSIRATATDSEDAENPITIRTNNSSFANITEQIALFNTIFARYLSRISKDTAVETWLDGKEAAAKAFLEDKNVS